MDIGEELRCQLDCQNDNNDDDMELIEGCDDALIGYTDSWNGGPWGRGRFIVGRPHRAVYDRDNCISILSGICGYKQDDVRRAFDPDVDIKECHCENGPIFVRVFKRQKPALANGKDFRSQLAEFIGEDYRCAHIVDGFDNAIIGYTDSLMGMNPDSNSLDDDDYRAGRTNRLVYDRDKCVRILAKTDGLKKKEAQSRFVSGYAEDYLGIGTPVYVTVLKQRK